MFFAEQFARHHHHNHHTNINPLHSTPHPLHTNINPIPSIERNNNKRYKALVLELLRNGIVPAVTMFHWDLPQGLQDRHGGFMDETGAFQDAFAYYADVLFRELGPYVKLWMTFNEPLSICELGYSKGVFAPGLKLGNKGQYRCGHNVLLAHARVYRLYQERYAREQRGRISVPLDGKWGFPFNGDSDAGERWRVTCFCEGEGGGAA